MSEGRTSPGRRVLFLAVCGIAAVGAVALGTRLVQLGAREEPPLPTHVGIDDGLRAQCMLGGEECAAVYGAELTVCRRPDCTMGWITTTPQGFVGPPGRVVDEERPPGTFRVLALGGSTTGGASWECGWPGRLEEELRERAADAGLALDFEVLNLGLPTAGSAELAALHRVIGARYGADAVIVGEEVNDLGNCAPLLSTPAPVTGYSQLNILASFLERDTPNEPLAGLSPWFARHEEAFREMRRRERLARAAEAARAVVAPRAETSPEERAEACRDAALPPLDDRPSILDDYEDGWRYTRRHLEALLDDVAVRGDAPVVLSTTPHAFEAWGCPTPGCAIVESVADWRAYLVRVHNPGLRALAEERAVDLADLERVMERAAPGAEARALFDEWMHPNCDGYAIIAERYGELLWPRVLAMDASRRAEAP